MSFESLSVEGLYDLVKLDVFYLWHAPDLIEDMICEAPGIPADVVVDMANAALCQGGQRILCVGGLQEVEVVLADRGREVGFEDDDVGVVDGTVRVEGGEDGGLYQRRAREDAAMCGV